MADSTGIALARSCYRMRLGAEKARMGCVNEISCNLSF